MTPGSSVLSGRQGEKKESGVLCTLSHWEHSQPMRPEVTGSFERQWQAQTALDGMSPLGFLLPASSLGSVRVRGNCLRPDAQMRVILDLVLHAHARFTVTCLSGFLP